MPLTPVLNAVCPSPDTPTLVRKIVSLQEASAALELNAILLEGVRKERERLWADIQAIVDIAIAEAARNRRPKKEWLGYAQDSLSSLVGFLDRLAYEENRVVFQSFLKDVKEYKAQAIQRVQATEGSPAARRSLFPELVIVGVSDVSGLGSRLQSSVEQHAENDKRVAACRNAILCRQGKRLARAGSLSSTSSEEVGSAADSVVSERNERPSVDSVSSEQVASVAATVSAEDLEEKTRRELIKAIEGIIVSYLITRSLYLTPTSLNANVWLNGYLARCEGAKNGIGVRYNKARLTTLETLHNAAHDSNATAETLRAAVKQAYETTVKDHAENSFFKRRRSSLVHQLEEAMKVEPIAVARM